MTHDAAIGEIAFSPGGETWIEFGPPASRERIPFHDYARLYAVAGLYERVFVELLGMRSTQVVAGLYAGALRDLGRDPAAERVLDLGAGNGMGGQELRAIGAGSVTGLDLEPAAREGAARDRPGVYDAYVVGDVAALEHEPFTALIAFSAIGAGHVPLELLAATIGRLVEPGGLYAFAIDAALRPGLDAFGVGEVLERVDYVHRRNTDGSDQAATAVVGRVDG